MYNLDKAKAVNKIIKVYIEGEGIQDHLSDDSQGYAFGSGYSSGIAVKVTKSFKIIRKNIASTIAKEEIVTEMDINVFGFSRGAAAARNFVAQTYRLQTEYSIENPKFNLKFIGLYDTVSSYSRSASASPDFDDDVKELKLKMERVQKVVHLTAGDEYRENFSLTNIKSNIAAGLGFELQLPGRIATLAVAMVS